MAALAASSHYESDVARSGKHDDHWEASCNASTTISEGRASNIDTLPKHKITFGRVSVPVTLPTASLSDSESDSDSAEDATPVRVNGRPLGQKALPTVAAMDSGSDSDSDSDVELPPMRSLEELLAASDRSNGASATSEPYKRMSFKPATRTEKSLPELKSFMAKLPPPDAAPKSTPALLSYLRNQNSKLREVLLEVQHVAEDAIAKKAQSDSEEDKTSIDFAHLLELAREFGDLSAEPLEDQDGSDDLASFSISTPRGTSKSSCGADSRVKQLEVELETARQDAFETQAKMGARDAELAARDEEIAALRRELQSRR